MGKRCKPKTFGEGVILSEWFLLFCLSDGRSLGVKGNKSLR